MRASPESRGGDRRGSQAGTAQGMGGTAVRSGCGAMLGKGGRRVQGRRSSAFVSGATGGVGVRASHPDFGLGRRDALHLPTSFVGGYLCCDLCTHLTALGTGPCLQCGHLRIQAHPGKQHGVDFRRFPLTIIASLVHLFSPSPQGSAAEPQGESVVFLLPVPELPC